ncbi:protein kinase family protein [Spirulina subsalsa]|uniref:protein kinase family protein n=1 Tax=Spirulina subsalsa TaxID=54311 RepID=UPI00031E132B|nr:protein kinase family protein [Spirulina subsalsa]
MGQLLNQRYQFIQSLGSEAMGQTVLVGDTQQSGYPRCVVKQLRLPSQPTKAVEVSLAIFEKKAEALKALGNHPQIPKIVDYFSENQSFYLVEEFITGRSLSQDIIPGHPFSEERVVELLVEVLEVLTFIHNREIIHRGIKPSNLIHRQSDDHIVITGFGIFREISTQILRSQGEEMDKPPHATTVYIPPEQAIGKAQFNSDLYALGMIGIQSLTGYSAEDLTQFDPAAEKKPEEGSWETNLKIHPRLLAILKKMVHPDYQQRYQSATDVLVDLQQWETAQGALVSNGHQEEGVNGSVPVITATSVAVKESEKKESERESVVHKNGASALPTPPLPTPSHPVQTSSDTTPEASWTPRFPLKWVGVALLGVGVLVGLFVALGVPQRVLRGQSLQQAREQVLKGDYQGAIATYNRVIDQHPDSAEAHYQRAMVHRTLGQNQRAIDDLTTAIQLGGKLDEAYYQRGNLRYLIGDRPGAIADYNAALEQNPNMAKVYVNRGLVHADQGNEPQALADYNQAIALDPTLAAAYLNRCLTRSNLDDHEGAILDCNQAINLRPTHPLAYQNRGLVYRRTGDLLGALKDYNIAIELDPDDPDPYYNRGLVRRDLGDQRGAIADFTTALELNPDHVVAYYDRGMVYLTLGEREKAIADFQDSAQRCLDVGRLGCYEDAKYQLEQLGSPTP